MGGDKLLTVTLYGLLRTRRLASLAIGRARHIPAHALADYVQRHLKRPPDDRPKRKKARANGEGPSISVRTAAGKPLATSSPPTAPAKVSGLRCHPQRRHD